MSEEDKPSLKTPPIGGKVRQPWERIGMSRASWYRHGKPDTNPKLDRMTQKKMATIAGVSLRQAQRTLRIQKRDPELLRRVLNGEISPAAAERQMVADEIRRLHEVYDSMKAETENG